MKKAISCLKRHAGPIAFAAIMMIGILMRVWRLTQYPLGINQDEAYAGYEAFSLLTTGADSHGYPFPVYFISWGSGMNVLYSYLTIPFVAMLGLNVLAVRLPQVILGILSIPVAWALGREIRRDKVFPLILAGVAAVDPWHIAISRFGLEANLLIFFLLLGLWLLLLGLRRPPAFLGAGAAFGLSLYCYAPVWTILPFFLIAALALLIMTKQLKVSGWLIGGIALLGLFAVPLVLFLLVNYGVINEIVTPYFSIPRLLQMRQNLSLEDMPEKLSLFFKMIFTQQESINTAQSDTWTGMHHYFSTPFTVAGLIFLCMDLVRTVRDRRFRPQVLILLLTLTAFPSTVMIDKLLIGRVVHSNTIQLCMLLQIAWGIYHTGELIGARHIRLRNVLGCVLLLGYLGGMVAFRYSYFIYHAVGWPFGYEEAIHAVQNDEQQRDVYLGGNIAWSILLFTTQMPPQEFRDTVTWRYYPGEFLEADTIGRYHFGIDLSRLDPHAIYLTEANSPYMVDVFNSIGFTCENHGRYDLWYAADPEAWIAEHYPAAE